MMQTTLVPDTRVLKLNVCKLGVTCLNTDDFKEYKSKWWHTGLGFEELLNDAEAFQKQVDEVIRQFKEYYNVENVEIFHLSELEYPFTGVKV